MIEENPYPEAIKEKAREELARYEMLPGASGEAGVVRTYLDWLLGVPWWQETEDNEDLKLVQQRLDEDHFGLEKVKNRIMEYLAVKQMTHSLNAPILCLVGAAGRREDVAGEVCGQSAGPEVCQGVAGRRAR